jgi:hypothetical protein
MTARILKELTNLPMDFVSSCSEFEFDGCLEIDDSRVGFERPYRPLNLHVFCVLREVELEILVSNIPYVFLALWFHSLRKEHVRDLLEQQLEFV